MNIHRILSGSPEHRKELIAAGIFVAVWFLMDLVQWVDWLAGKMAPQVAIAQIQNVAPPHTFFTPDGDLMTPYPPPPPRELPPNINGLDCTSGFYCRSGPARVRP